MSYTKIVATIGPATSSVENLTKLAKAGVSICRMNFSHGSHEVHGQVIRNIRAVNAQGYTLGIMLDTKGPEIRSGDVKEPIMIKAGQRVFFTSKTSNHTSLATVHVNYPHFAKDVRHASCILLDNGAIEFRVESFKDGGVIAIAKESGKIGSRRHINLPGAHISLPSFTKQDWLDIGFGVKQGVDFIATSFVRTGKDIKELKNFLRKNGSAAEIFAKIETPEAVDNIEDIVREADGIMVARGDLGSEVPFEEVPAIQDDLVQRCRAAGKPVIVATHMLESMIQSPMPTRAEVTDIAYAARSKADCTMLSGETTTGQYPFKAVDAMVRVLRRNEQGATSDELTAKAFDKAASHLADQPRHEQARAACVLATKLDADAIVVMSRSGKTARAVSQFRPPVPILACTNDASVARRLMISWGVHPFTLTFSDDPETTVRTALALFAKKKVLRAKQRIVVVSDIQTGSQRVMTIQIRQI